VQNTKQLRNYRKYNHIRKVASPHVQVALQPHESKKLNLVVPEKSCDFSYTIKNRGIKTFTFLRPNQFFILIS